MKKRSILKDFKNSFKPKKSILYIIIFDLLFYGFAVILIKALGVYLTNISAGINLPASLTDVTEDQMPALAAQMQGLFLGLLLSTILFLILIMASWSITRGLIYSTLLKNKTTKKYLLRFTLLNLVLAVPFLLILILFIAIAALLKNIFPYYNYIFYAIFLAMSYYISINYILFTKKQNIFESIGRTISFGTKNILKMFVPCLLILMVSALISLIQSYFISAMSIAPFVSLVVFIIFMAWARTYFVQEVEKI